jgi:hypothetical protein
MIAIDRVFDISNRGINLKALLRTIRSEVFSWSNSKIIGEVGETVYYVFELPTSPCPPD